MIYSCTGTSSIVGKPRNVADLLDKITYTIEKCGFFTFLFCLLYFFDLRLITYCTICYTSTKWCHLTHFGFDAFAMTFIIHRTCLVECFGSLIASLKQLWVQKPGKSELLELSVFRMFLLVSGWFTLEVNYLFHNRRKHNCFPC